MVYLSKAQKRKDGPNCRGRVSWVRIAQVKNSFGKMELAGGMLQLANKADCIEIYGLFGASKLIASHADHLDISSLPAGTYRYIRCVRDSTKMTGKVTLP